VTSLPVARSVSLRTWCAGATEGLAKGEWLAAVRGCSFEAWRKSPRFDAIMLTDDFVVAGVGKAHNPQSLYGWYWTLDLGSYDDSQATSLP